MIKVGIVGLGFMGWIHWLAYRDTPGVEVAAVCTPEADRRAGDWTGSKAISGRRARWLICPGSRPYESLDQMLADDRLDLIDICLPPALHSDAIIAAASSGKHVFCEKPLALNLADCDRAVSACQEHDRMMMVGQVLPFFTEYQFATRDHRRWQLRTSAGRFLSDASFRILSG